MPNHQPIDDQFYNQTGPGTESQVYHCTTATLFTLNQPSYEKLVYLFIFLTSQKSCNSINL